MAEEARTSVATAVSRKLWIPFLIWVIALVVAFRGHFLEEWHRNQLLNAIKISDQQAFESLFEKGWYPTNGFFRSPKASSGLASLLDFALAAGNYQAARFLWDNLPVLHEPKIIASAWPIAASYGYPQGLVFMHGIDPTIIPASLTSLLGDSVNYPGLTSDIKIPAADQQQHLFSLELLVSWGAIPASSSPGILKRAIVSGLADCAAFLIKHGSPCESSALLLHAVLRQRDLSPAVREMLCSLLLARDGSATQTDKSGIKAIDLAEDLLKKYPGPEHSRIVDMMKNPPVHAPLATDSLQDGASQ